MTDDWKKNDAGVLVPPDKIADHKLRPIESTIVVRGFQPNRKP